MIPLTVSPVGKEVQIKKAIVNKELKQHLDHLGLLAGQRVTLVSDSRGDLILKVKDGRLAINKDLAMKIFVE